MYFEFYLDDLEIEEPQGFADIILNMKRDDNWHGIFFEASTSELSFYGVAAAYLKNKKATEGLKSEVTFKAYQACGVYEEPELLVEGRLDFGKYTESCGGTCVVEIPVEQLGCLMTLRNRYDQKVDLDSTVTFNKMSALQQYEKINFAMDLPAKAIRVALEGRVSNEPYTIQFNFNQTGTSTTIVRPTYDVEISNSIQTGQLIPVSDYESTDDAFDSPISPQILFEGEPACFNGDFEYEALMKGSYNIVDIASGFDLSTVKIKVVTWDGTGTIFANATLIQEVTVFTGPVSLPQSGTFNTTVSGTVPYTEGVGFYAFVEFVIIPDSSSVGDIDDFQVTFDPETYINVNGVSLCSTTSSNVYAVNETLSRITEAITDNCLKVKSNYYGRTDSQPYTSAEDGCGSLRVLTSGLKIRRAENPLFFSSLKDMFDGLRGIDNIGMGIEANEFIPGFNWLRIEPVEYFYQDIEVLRLPYVPEPKISTQEQLHYSLIKSGYQKWEVERVNGLDEPNSNREYRTSLTSVNNTLDITSKFEVTRQQSFADTGAADTTYDNETFIICVERQAYSFIVERGNIDNAANVFSPQTLYNWRIRPYSNLMRWFKSIANSYPNINDSANKLYFSSGTGNLLAEGQLSDAFCKLENGVKAENRDLSKMDFADPVNATPLWKPDNPTFRYPLSVADYKALKANPYGYISFQCGTGEWKKGYVQDLRYRLNKGEADFVLKLKYS
jgi:hypothetical protein